MIERQKIVDRTTWLEWRQEDVTASVGACLFGADIHPYTTAYQQWAIHSGLVSKPGQIDPKLARRGSAIELMSPWLIREEKDWTVKRNRFYYRDPQARIGATPDLIGRKKNGAYGNIQVKSVGPGAFRQWKDRDTGEVALPIWIAIQANIEAHLMGAEWAAVAAITIGDAGLDIEIIDVPLDADLMKTYRAMVADFWRRVEEREPYDIDWGKDAAIVLAMYKDSNGSTVDLSRDEREFPDLVHLVDAREGLKDIETEGDRAAKARKLIDVEIIAALGNAAKGRLADGRLVQAETIKRKGYTVEPASYRTVKVKP